MEGAPGYGGGTVVPAGTSAALVISTASILRPARAAQFSADCDWADKGAHSALANRSESLHFVIADLLFREQMLALRGLFVLRSPALRRIT